MAPRKCLYSDWQGSIFQMSIWLTSLLLISANANESFKRFSGEDNTSMMWSNFLTFALAWFSFDMWWPFRFMGLSRVILVFCWTDLGLFRFWYSIGFRTYEEREFAVNIYDSLHICIVKKVICAWMRIIVCQSIQSGAAAVRCCF